MMPNTLFSSFFVTCDFTLCVCIGIGGGGGASQIAIIYQATEAAALSPLLPPFGWLE